MNDTFTIGKAVYQKPTAIADIEGMILNLLSLVQELENRVEQLELQLEGGENPT